MQTSVLKLMSHSARVRLIALAFIGAAGLAASGGAQARDNVFWSIGIASPGVSIGVANAAPVYVQPAPVYVQPAPVVVQRPVAVYAPPPVVYRPAPVVVEPIGWVPPGYVVRERKHKHHHHHNRPEWYEGPGYRY